MKKVIVQCVLKHTVDASPREIIENYVDYGHEVYAHGKYSKSQRKHISKITKVRYRVISQYEREVVVPISFFAGLIKYASVQKVRLIHWSGIVSEGDLYGFPARSRWFIFSEKDEKGTFCWVVYEIEIPWFLSFLAPFIRIAIKHLRYRIWEEDKIMLERRDRLIKRGFGDGGIQPSHINQ